MSNKTSPLALPWAKLVLGLVLMIGGMYVSQNSGDLQKTIQDSLGLPLDPGKTLAAIGVFLIVFPVIDLYYLKPLKEAIDERSNSLESTFTEAEQLRTDMEEMKVGYEKQLADTEASAREQIQAQVKEATDLRKTLMAEAEAKADELVKRANEEIEAEKQKALTELRVNVSNLSLMAAEKIIGGNMDEGKNQKIIDEFLASVEAKN
jgi:F-type H+-transporting ATPase subunit b